MSSIRTLFLHFGQFLGTNTLLLLLGFLTFPILTRLLTREDYGILGLVTNTIAIAVAVAKGGISDGIIRFYKEHADTTDRLTLFTSTVLARGVVLTALVVGSYVFALPLVIRLIGVDPRYVDCFLVMAVYLFARPLNIAVMNFMRARGDILTLNVFNAAMRITEIALAFALLLWLVGELYGYFLGVALVQLGATAFFLRWLLKSHRFSVYRASGPLTWDLLKFGFPLLLTELAYLLLSYADRYMMVAYHGQDALGMYTVGYNVPSYVNDLVMFSLSYAIVPIYTELYRREGRQATEAFLSRALNYYVMAVIPLCVGYAAVSQDMLVTLASQKYADSASFSPLIMAGLVFLGMNYILYAGLYLEKKTGQILAVMLAAVAVNIGANLVLLPKHGAMGAATATLIACLLSTVVTAFLSRPYLRVTASPAGIVYYSLASAAMYVLVTRIDTGLAWLNLLAKVPAGAAIMAAATLLREQEVRELARRLLRRVFGRPA